MTRAFAGIRVIDLTHVLAGPFATYQLAVLGADVIKIEHPERPDQVRETGTDPALGQVLMGTNYLSQGSNKRSLTLDLTQPAGREVLARLLATADVLVENYRAGALEALGFGYEAAIALKPDLVYCSITGFGQTGPKRAYTAYDGIVQASSGLMSVTGTPEVTPLKVGAPVIDYAAGTTAALAISAALHARARTGEPQFVDVSMQDVALMLMSSNITGLSASGQMLSTPRGNDFVTAEGSCYRTRDGMIMIAALNRRQQERLWGAVGRPDLGPTPEDATQTASPACDAERRKVLAETFAGAGAQEWEQRLNAAGVPAARVGTVAEALASEQVATRPSLTHVHPNLFGDDRDITVPVAGFGFARGGPSIDNAPPAMGADSLSILEELGYGAGAIDGLLQARVTSTTTNNQQHSAGDEPSIGPRAHEGAASKNGTVV
ncbi:MAG: CoA transferase [Chelatococcus sp.]|uniref:CaiB/BaiF CoA transferase family protein n=1 Tax=Chelatococcus sp. TaxID=1953771 RepID=UPI0025BDDE31|nr:CoA transferase [Chelatococcus sp.]MBX3540874.1 CoA transferase [Chelatococcus sp.]